MEKRQLINWQKMGLEVCVGFLPIDSLGVLFFFFSFFFFKYPVSCFPISDGRVWIKKLQPISQSRTIFGCTTDPLMWGFEFDRVLRCTHRCTQLSKFNYNQTMLVLVVGQSILTIYVTFIYLDYYFFLILYIWIIIQYI